MLTKDMLKCEKIELHCDCSYTTQIKYAAFDFTQCSFVILRFNNYSFKDKQFIRHDTKIQNFDSDSVKLFDNDCIFKVNSAVMYSGDLNSGHYTCLVNKTKNWISLSDDISSVCEDPSKSFLSKIYYLILEKIAN